MTTFFDRSLDLDHDDAMSYGLHWFRRDLRVAGNPGLHYNWRMNKGRVIGVFTLDKTFLARPDLSNSRFAFFLETLHCLKRELQGLGSDLLVLELSPIELVEFLKDRARTMPNLVTICRDYEPFARARDEKLRGILSSSGVEQKWFRDHLVLEPTEIEKSEAFYKVYTPFSRKWTQTLLLSRFQERCNGRGLGLQYLGRLHANQPIRRTFKLDWLEVLRRPDDSKDVLQKYLKNFQADVALPQAGSLAAFKALESFKAKLNCYSSSRDTPAAAGTSRLSIYLKNGSISAEQVIAHLGLKSSDIYTASGASMYLKELIWREFYYYILWHRPDVENHTFLPKYRNLAWENNKGLFEAWCKGLTGFPIVDAGIRELLTTGWMHNRARMVVASFLTKDLLVDWRWGERFFMNHLLDGDLAPNNGGWQWAASTGCDPQPYFRIFNPELQSRKFDPSGEYIRRFVPELRHLKNAEIHAPGKTANYPAPIVNHRIQRSKALSLFLAE